MKAERPAVVKTSGLWHSAGVLMTFASALLRERYVHPAVAEAAWGAEAASMYISAITVLQCAPTLEDVQALRSFSLRRIRRDGTGARFALRPRLADRGVEFTHMLPSSAQVEGLEDA